jgi:hypothetical protein
VKKALAVFAKLLVCLMPVPSIWPINPQRLPAKVIRIPPPNRSSRWN